MRREVSGIILIVLALLFCPTGMAQGPLPDASWDACRKAPTRACILDEAILLALSVEPSLRRPTQLGKLAELEAAIGNVPAALGIAQSIPPDHRRRGSSRFTYQFLNRQPCSQKSHTDHGSPGRASFSTPAPHHCSTRVVRGFT